VCPPRDLPADVVKILPWASVSIGPTGAMPQAFWQKIGAAASTVVNSLLVVGPMIYKGLVALGTFLVNLAEAIVDWGMRALGAVRGDPWRKPGSGVPPLSAMPLRPAWPIGTAA